MTATMAEYDEPVALAGRGRAARAGRRTLVVAAGALGLAWLVAVVTYLLGVAAVVPVILLVGTASLLRGGRTLLDRLMLAFCVLLGATCGGALIFAVWPWGMHPVAVGGFALSGLVLVAVLTGRRPTLPRPAMADVLTMGAALGTAIFTAVPLLRREPVDRLAFVVMGEDMSRHLSLFDGLRSLGGYAFEQWDAAHGLMYKGMVTYPQGQHMLAALLDGFWRSSTAPHDSGLTMMDHYLASQVLGYVTLGLAMIWGAQWIAAPVLTPLRRIVLVGVVTTFTAVGDLVGNLVLNYSTTALGLAQMVLLIAVLARGVASTRQQMVTIACLLIAIGFTYYLYLPAALLAVAIWMVVNRRRLLRHRLAAAVTIVVCAPVALLPISIGLLVANQAMALMSAGELLRPSRDHMIALAALVVGSVLFTRARRSPVWRRYLGALLACALLAGALTTHQIVYEVGNGYYPDKTLHLVIVALVVGMGAVLYHLPPPRRDPDPRRAWLRAVVPGLVAALVLAGGVGLIRDDAPYRRGTDWTMMWWYQQRRNGASAEAIMKVLAAGPPAPGVAVLVHDSDVIKAYFHSLFVAALQGTAGLTAPGLYLGVPLNEPGRLDKQILALPGAVLFVVDTDEEEAQVRDAIARHPGRSVDVARLGS